jgi:hypothetical protein
VSRAEGVTVHLLALLFGELVDQLGCGVVPHPALARIEANAATSSRSTRDRPQAPTATLASPARVDVFPWMESMVVVLESAIIDRIRVSSSPWLRVGGPRIAVSTTEISSVVEISTCCTVTIELIMWTKSWAAPVATNFACTRGPVAACCCTCASSCLSGARSHGRRLVQATLANSTS